MRTLRLFLILLAALPALARELHWENLTVNARLDANGRLAVEERHAMRFTGNWNGGERLFNIREGQKLVFGGMSSVDASGAETAMPRGSLRDIGNWDFTSSNVLRWRARGEADAVFDDTPFTWVLRYELRNVLQREGDFHVLDHDFAFSSREGVIEHFVLNLTIDPAWQPTGPLQEQWTVDNLEPGKSFVLRVPLRHQGAAAPPPDSLVGDDTLLLLRAIAAVPLLLLGFALLREKMLGRFEPIDPDDISRSWLEQNVLNERAEVIGAMWDRSVGPPEVSAALARMVAEGRLESKVAGEEMDLTINTRKDLNEYEQALLDGLFFRGNHTSTSKIQKHYADSGFDPAEKMSAGLKKTVEERLAARGTPAKPWGFHLWLLFAASVAALGFNAWTNPGMLGKSIAILVGSLFIMLFTLIAPNGWRERKYRGLVSALLSLIPAAIVTGGVAFFLWRSETTGQPFLTLELKRALALLAIWIAATAIHTLRSRESREAIGLLRRLGATREMFKRELKNERPSLEDAWYPYLLAFGLGGHVDRWSKAFPGTSRGDDDFGSRSSSSSTSSSSGSSTSSPSSWSGGGGAFGGAGATGMWAAAATGMASGVSAPSSSSSDGGGSSSSSSSSGGSSGGGGGGGW